LLALVMAVFACGAAVAVSRWGPMIGYPRVVEKPNAETDAPVMQAYQYGSNIGTGYCDVAVDKQPALMSGGDGERCFCLFTGHCQEEFQDVCQQRPLEECQRLACMGRNALEVTGDAASFTNMKDAADILTIPVPYYRDLSALKACRADADTFLAVLLEAGRRVFVGSRAGGPHMPQAEWQCIHLPGKVSVSWLHIHSFVGFVPGEALPAHPPSAVCANNSMGPWEAARYMLRQTPR